MITKADAVAAIEAVTHDLSGEIQFSDAIAAINALPDSVTDDMVVELKRFAEAQEPLGAEFEKVLNDNIEQLYEP